MAPRSRLAPVRGEIISLRKQGWTLQAIGDEFGCTREAIRLIVKDEGIRLVSARQVRRLLHAVVVIGRLQFRVDNGGTVSRHGTRVRYSRGCPCDACRLANRAHIQSLKGKTPPRHGNSGYMNYGCRCDVCKAENSAYQWRTRKQWRRRKQATA